MSEAKAVDPKGATEQSPPRATPRSARANRPSRYAPGEVVAEKYRLERLLARGGMGEVWIARHEHLNTEVAVKFLDRVPDADAENVSIVLERFRFEAQISARLGARTKHIVAVYDAGTHGGVPYLVMEYVRGRTLESIIDELGMVPPERLADILEQVADALAVAHELGIVHRDIKPSNIMLAESEPLPAAEGEAERAPKTTVKLADFGVAKAVKADLTLDRPKDTSEGLLVGSPAYMSPEQLRCDGSLDPRSDVWSLGVVAYEALTGWPPFAGGSIADLIISISTRPVDPPSSIRATLPKPIDAWFTRALAKDREERFADPVEMARAFRAAVGAAAPKTGNRKRVALGVAAALALALFLVIASKMVGPGPAVAGTSTATPSVPDSPGEEARPIVATAPAPATASAPAPEPSAAAADTVPRGAGGNARRKPGPTTAPPPVATPPPVAAPGPTAVPSASPRPRKDVDPSETQ